jgi:hypothetical protein
MVLVVLFFTAGEGIRIREKLHFDFADPSQKPLTIAVRWQHHLNLSYSQDEVVS